MTIKKLTAIAVGGALLLAGAIGISIELTRPQEMALAVDAAQEESELPKTLENIENMPLYYNDRDILLLPLRNVIEGLGGTVSWDAETRQTEISYRGKKLLLQPGETEATLNGYEITLPKAAEMINGCLYADEAILTAYYTGDVVWNTGSEQITLQAKDHAIPIVAQKTLTAARDGRAYSIDLPVIVGLNDANFEKSLNESIRREILEHGEAFPTEAAEDAEAAELTLTLHMGWISADFISLWWEGTQGGEPIYLTKNIDLVAQKSVTAADLWEADAQQPFYLDADGTAMLLHTDAEGQHWAAAALEWKKAYRSIFGAAAE